MSQRSRLWCFVLVAACGVPGFLAPPLLQADAPKSREGRKPVAKALASGLLLARQASDAAWQAIPADSEVSSRDLLLALPGDRAGLTTSNGAVELLLSGNLPQMSDSAAREAAVILHEPASGTDLNLTLERGRVFLINRRSRGAAHVRCGFGDATAELTLDEPGSTLVLEYYGRILQGVPFNKDPKQAAQPAFELDALAVKEGSAVKIDDRSQHLQPPPGPAMTRWSSGEGLEPTAERVDRLPAWAEANAISPADRPARQNLEVLGKLLKEKPLDAALAQLLQEAAAEKDPGQAAIRRGMALYGMSAVDDVAGLVDVLTEGKSSEARATAIDALRHYIGRAMGNDVAVYKVLLDRKKLSQAHAAIATDLLHSFSPAQLREPETLDLLLSYVKSPRLVIREEARWHLSRIVPHAREVVYDPAGPPQEQERAYQEWKKRIPARPSRER